MNINKNKLRFLKISNTKLLFATLISVVFLFIFSNYLYKMSIFKLGIGEYLEKQQSNYSEGPTYSQRYNSTNNTNSNNPWDYKKETYSDYLKRLTTSTNVSSDYQPNDFSNSKLSLFDANLLVYSDKYIREEFPETAYLGWQNTPHWYNPIESSVHYGPDYVDNNSKTFGYEKWKDIYFPPSFEESIFVELSDPSTLNSQITISSKNNFENIKYIRVTNNHVWHHFTSIDIQTWRDDPNNIPTNLKVTPAKLGSSASRFSFLFKWENTNDPSYDGNYELLSYHNPYNDTSYRGGNNHYLLKGPDRVDGYNIEVDNSKVDFDKNTKTYSVPMKWNIDIGEGSFSHFLNQVDNILFNDDFFPWVDVNNKWTNFHNINQNHRSMALSSIYYGYGLDKNLSIIDNTNLLRTLSFFTSPGDEQSNPSNPGAGIDGISKSGPGDNTILTSYLNNYHFVGLKGDADTRYYKPAYIDKNNISHYMKSPFIYNPDNYYTRLLPWVDVYKINHLGEYDLIDSQYVFDPNVVVWKAKEMNEDDGPIIEVNFDMKIQNSNFNGMNEDNLTLDIVNYAPYAHNNGGLYNKFIVSSNNIVISVDLSISDYFFNYYLNYKYMNIMLMDDLNNKYKYKFKFKIFISFNKYDDLKEKKIQYYTNNMSTHPKDTKKQVKHFVDVNNTNKLVPLQLEIDIDQTEDIENIAFVIEDTPPPNSPAFNFIMPFGTNLVMKDIVLERNPKKLLINFSFMANEFIKDDYYYWGSELITYNSLTSSTRMEVEGSNNSSYQIKDGINVVRVVIDNIYISSIDNLKDNFIFGYSDSLDDHPTQDKTFKVYNEDLQNITIPKVPISESQKLVTKIIILTSVIAFFIISVFSSGVALFIRSNKQTRMVINSLDDDIFNSDDMEEDFELSL